MINKATSENSLVHFQELSYQWRTSLYLAASASAEFFADMMLAPMEATKVRIQTAPGAPPTLRGCAPMIYRTEGFSGFYKGIVRSFHLVDAVTLFVPNKLVTAPNY